MAAAALVAVLSEGRSGARSLLSQYSLSRVRWPWPAFAALSPVLLTAIGVGSARLVEGEWPSCSELPRTDNLPAMALPLTLLVHIFAFGLGEETGWRGFALPRLQQDRTAIGVTDLLAVGWGL